MAFFYCEKAEDTKPTVSSGSVYCTPKSNFLCSKREVEITFGHLCRLTTILLLHDLNQRQRDTLSYQVYTSKPQYKALKG